MSVNTINTINELVILSGKGGTGKTTVCASLAASFNDAGRKCVLADCDVDAPDLHILMEPEKKSESEFSGPNKGKINSEICTGCGLCQRYCRFEAIRSGSDGKFRVNLMLCEGCGVCEFICPEKAVSMTETRAGTIFESSTPYGTMIHGRLIPGEETSGKLVSAVREKAKDSAEKEGIETVIIDGSPGVGCNVISSVTGSSKAIIVTEPSQSGLHDMTRLMDLLDRFSIPYFVIINKFDISLPLSDIIEGACKERDAEVILKIPFSPKIVESISQKKIPAIDQKELFNDSGWDRCIQTLINGLD